MALCERLVKQCIGADCNSMVFEGAEPNAWLFNKAEIESLTPVTDEPNLISAIVMGEDDQQVAYVGYRVAQLGKTPYSGSNTTMAEGNIMNTFTETVQFLVPDNSPAASVLLDNMAGGKFLMVMENQFAGTDSKGKFQVYGAKKALSCTAMERQLYSDDTNGGWLVTLTAEKQPVSAMFIYTTSEAATRTYLDGITTDCTTSSDDDQNNG